MAALRLPLREKPINTAFNFINFHVLNELNDSDVQLKGLGRTSNTNHFPMMVTFSLNQSYWAAQPDIEMSVMLHYDRSIFSAEFMDRAKCVFTEILESMAYE